MVSLVLIMLFLTPVFQTDTYLESYLIHHAALDMAIDTYNRGLEDGPIAGSWPAYQATIDTLVEGTTADSFYPVLWFALPDPDGPPFNTDVLERQPNKGEMETDPTRLRFSEFSAVLATADNGTPFLIAYSTSRMARLEAFINLMRTIFVTFVLAIAALHFNSMTNKWVMLPIERMLEKVRLIAKNPLAVAQEDVEMAGVYSMMQTTVKEQ